MYILKAFYMMLGHDHRVSGGSSEMDAILKSNTHIYMSLCDL